MFFNNNQTNSCKPAKAGSWYSADPTKLAQELQNHLDRVPSQKEKIKPRMILVPHPGLAFGGTTAAYAYKAVSEYKYRNIFLIGISHSLNFSGISIGDYDYYETPLGPLKVNKDITSYLFKINEEFKFIPQAHMDENSLEMQLPFIKHVLGDHAQIIPILLSGYGYESAELLAKTIHEIITPDDLVIISSDFSHYPSYDDANRIDKETINAALTCDPKKFIAKMTELSQNPPPNCPCFACGDKALVAGLYLAQKLNLKEAALLHYENSGDFSFGDKSQVVGYGALVYYASLDEQFAQTAKLMLKDKKTLLKIARKTLENHFLNKKMDFTEFDIQNLKEKYGVFVTLKINGQLRGCIGNFEPKEPLYLLTSQTVLLSAFQDTRFRPLTKEEVDQLEIDISVLSPRKKIKFLEEIIPGKHGVFIRKGFRGGTYLPQVAPEQNWDRAQMMNSLCEQKSGLPAVCWQDGSADMYTYTALVLKD
jgi:MEMO1 family protein